MMRIEKTMWAVEGRYRGEPKPQRGWAGCLMPRSWGVWEHMIFFTFFLCAHVHATVQEWSSENNLWRSVQLSLFTPWVLRLEIRLATGFFTHGPLYPLSHLTHSKWDFCGGGGFQEKCVNTLKTILKQESACKCGFPCLGGQKRGQNAYIGPVIFRAVVISPSI